MGERGLLMLNQKPSPKLIHGLMATTLERDLLMLNQKLNQKANHGIMVDMVDMVSDTVSDTDMVSGMVITLERDLLMLNQKANHIDTGVVDTTVVAVDTTDMDMGNKPASHY